MAEARPEIDYVFGYGSLAELRRPLLVAGVAIAPVAARLRGFRRVWGAAMNNWETGDDEKHFVDPRSGGKPRVRIAFLDIEEAEGSTVNGLAVPVDSSRLAEFDAREVNYTRFELSDALEPAFEQRVYAYRATAGARERLEAGARDGDAVVGQEYLELVRRAFAGLGGESLAEFERTTAPLPFPQRDLELRQPESPDATGS
ncbi:MAG TPA: gamma-glutamylcyclotransferase family protein [Solirubrobacterales bacterium]